MDCPVEYTTNTLTDTVHLIRVGAAEYKALCGQEISHWHTYGDETLSGIAATCKKCRAIFKGQPMNRRYVA